jgi:ubiquinone/menaquinone biosynthesis C-methylase UbiE
MIEERKNKEAKFHDILRDEKLQDNSLEFERLTSNYKFYSITRRSQNFVDSFLINNCSGRRVLDYCCGDGKNTIFLAKNGADAFGIDISPVSIQNAKTEAEKKGFKNASFFVMDAEKLEFADNFFDLIVCSGVLHHLNIEKAYQELSRILKLDGKIVCDEPLIYNPIFQLYRKLTPHLRTKWEREHILGRGDIKLAEKYFGKVEKRFFHLFVLLAVPFRNILFIFNPFLAFLGFIDSLILRMPLVKWWAWQIVFIMSRPKKQYGGKEAKRN